jgi:Cu/Ag efflux pump CusA
MAVVILGGLVTSTFLNLFIVPALYLRFGAGSVKKIEMESAARLATSAT